MSITVESSPSLVAIIGNRIGFKLSTDNNIETVGIVTQAYITFATVGLANDSFTIDWEGHSIQFTCKVTPDDSGTQIPTTPANIADWVAAVAAAVGLNYQVDQDFVVTSSGPELRLTAREKGLGNVVSLESDWTGAAPGLSGAEGTDEVARLFFKLGIQVLIKSGVTFNRISEDILPVDSANKASFDIRRNFADQLDSVFKFPEASDQLMILRENMCREYKVRYFERYGSDLTVQKIGESASFWVLNAGISYLQEAIYNRQDSSFWDKLGYNLYFLTWQPKTKYIDRYQTEKLYYLVQAAIANLLLKIEINYNDATPQSILTKDTTAGPTNKGVYELALTLNVLQLAGYDQGNIDNYRVWMEDGASNRISEIRTYVMDYEHHEYVRCFLFLNSLGGFDTLRTTGDVSDGIEHERTEISKVLGEDFTEMDHQVAAGSVYETKVYKANTGWKEAEDISWIRDFLLSKQVYQLIAGKLVPIVITSTKATQRIDKEDLYSISFEYRRAFKNEFYSKQIVHADFNDDFNDDFANE